MRLFGKVDGAIDRFDRAGWLTLPFDLAFLVTTTAGAGGPWLDVTYLGRYRLGDMVPVHVECSATGVETDPDASPTVTIYDSSGNAIVSGVSLERQDLLGVTGWFVRLQRLNAAFSTGRYDCRVEYAVNGVAQAGLSCFEVVPGGDAGGAYAGLGFLGAPQAAWLVGMLETGTLQRRRNPGLPETSLTFTDGSPVPLWPEETQYLGRYRVGDIVPLHVQCRGSGAAEFPPTSVPTVDVYDSSGNAVHASLTMSLHRTEETDSWFQLPLRLGRGFSSGRYDVWVGYGSFAVNQTFEVVAGGEVGGAYIGVQNLQAPQAEWLVGVLQDGSLQRRKTPRIEAATEVFTDGSAVPLQVGEVVYLGRVRLGGVVQLSVECRGVGTGSAEPDDAPNFTVFDAEGRSVDSGRMSRLGRRGTAGFHVALRAGQAYAPGRYDVLVEYANTSEFRQQFCFELMAGGAAEGGHIGLTAIESLPHTAVVGVAEDGTIYLQKKPRI